MADAPPVRLVTREEWRHALEQSKKPGRAAIVGATTGLGTAALLLALGDAQAFNRWTVVKLAIGLLVGLAVHLLINLWKAPRETAAEDRKPLEKAIENLQAENARLRRELSKRHVEDTETVDQLKALAAAAQGLLRVREQPRYGDMTQAIWRNEYYDLRDQIRVVRISDGERLDLLSEFREVSGNRIYDQMEDNVRGALPKLVALLLNYEKRATEGPS